ncbi:MAG: 3-isopropylmalate dehydratase small subunit [Elusimicrobiota bacterium]
MKISGKVIKYGDNINTDLIIPAKYLNTSDPDELAKHCMAGLDADFQKKVKDSKIIVAGSNFGCGSSREHAPVCLKAAGILCIIADSYARIFARNSINIGLPIVELKDAEKIIQSSDKLEVLFDNGIIRNLSSSKEYKFAPFPEFLQRIIKSGGLIEYIKSKG